MRKWERAGPLSAEALNLKGQFSTLLASLFGRKAKKEKNQAYQAFGGPGHQRRRNGRERIDWIGGQAEEEEDREDSGLRTRA
jgi:hypothetical protein